MNIVYNICEYLRFLAYQDIHKSMKLLFCSSIMFLLCLILTLIIDTKGQSARRVLCQSSSQCQEGQYCDLRPVTCGVQGCFG